MSASFLFSFLAFWLTFWARKNQLICVHGAIGLNSTAEGDSLFVATHRVPYVVTRESYDEHCEFAQTVDDTLREVASVVSVIFFSIWQPLIFFAASQGCPHVYVGHLFPAEHGPFGRDTKGKTYVSAKDLDDTRKILKHRLNESQTAVPWAFYRAMRVLQLQLSELAVGRGLNVDVLK